MIMMMVIIIIPMIIIRFYIIYVLAQQPQIQLQRQHRNIMEFHKYKQKSA